MKISSERVSQKTYKLRRQLCSLSQHPGSKGWSEPDVTPLYALWRGNIAIMIGGHYQL